VNDAGRDWENISRVQKACGETIIRKFVGDSDAFVHPNKRPQNTLLLRPLENGGTVLKKVQK